jgi:methionine-rich copper-binding protein CopC
METVPTGAGWTGNLAGKTLQQAVFAGLVDPAQIVPVRLLRTPAVGATDCGAAAPTNCDTAIFSGPLADYDLTFGASFVTVAHSRGTTIDGVDTVRNVERLQFADQTLGLGAPAAPAIGVATAGNTTATVAFTPASAALAQPITSFTVFATTGSTTTTITGIAPNATSATIAGLTNGLSYTFTVAAVNAVGTGAQSAASNAVVPTAQLLVAPSTPAANATGVPVAANITANFSRTVVAAQVNATNVVLRRTSDNSVVSAAVTYAQNPNRLVTINPTINLLPNTQYTVTFNAGSCPSGAAGAGIRTNSAPCSALAATSWSFTTDPAPAVESTTPVNGRVGFGRGANITVTFSENVTGVSAATAVVTRTSDGTAVPAVVTYNAATRTATINPNANLRAATQFTVTLVGSTAAIRSATAPNVPLATTSFSFTTA